MAAMLRSGRGNARSGVEVAIVGAGPYGLSIAAHLREAGVSFRIFGEPMDSWVSRMPRQMLLKSAGFASNISDPAGRFTLERFCAEAGIAYSADEKPVSRETFAAYGLYFQDRLVPDLERRVLQSLDRDSRGFSLAFEDGERVAAKAVVLAVGLSRFAYVPDELARLPDGFVSHSAGHTDMAPFTGRKVAVIGGGASAIELALSLEECGAEVQLIARQLALRFHSQPTGERRPLRQQLVKPMTGMGPGWRARFYEGAPIAFRYLPLSTRRGILTNFLPAEGGWFSRDRLLEKVPRFLGHSLASAAVENGEVCLGLTRPDGSPSRITVDHVIAATGYRVNVANLDFLSASVRQGLRSAHQAPILSTRFESSVPGLYFAGLPAALSFGPMFRFILGAGFAARRLAGVLKARSQASAPSSVLVSRRVDGWKGASS